MKSAKFIYALGMSFFLIACHDGPEVSPVATNGKNLRTKALTTDPEYTLREVVVTAPATHGTVTFTGIQVEGGSYYGYYSGGNGEYYGSYDGSGHISDSGNYYSHTLPFEDPYQSIKEDWNRLTSEEKLLMLTILSVLDLQGLRHSKNVAESEALWRFGYTILGKQSLTNGRGDAFRHAYFSALTTRYLGSWKSEMMGNAHENFPGNDALIKAMDLFNNARGRTLYAMYPDATQQELADIVYQDMLEGNLREIRGGLLVPTGPADGELDPGRFIKRPIASTR